MVGGAERAGDREMIRVVVSRGLGQSSVEPWAGLGISLWVTREVVGTLWSRRGALAAA
jgi:hypothetical protein